TDSGPEEVVPWASDAAVLVARLCTYHGHLPQGAPSSPLMANVAFLPYDRRIVRALGGSLVYSRYFDDITISLSAEAARELGIFTPRDLMTYAAKRIQRALANTGFRLNTKKTRAADLRYGHCVTGLRLSTRSVELPRKAKRRLRRFSHLIRR